MNPEIFKITQDEIDLFNNNADFNFVRADYIIQGIKKKTSVYAKRFLELGFDPMGNHLLTVQCAIDTNYYTVHVDSISAYNEKNIDARNIRQLMDAFDLERVFTKPLERIYPYRKMSNFFAWIDSPTKWFESRKEVGHIYIFTMFDISKKEFVKFLLQAENDEFFFVDEFGGRTEVDDPNFQMLSYVRVVENKA